MMGGFERAEVRQAMKQMDAEAKERNRKHPIELPYVSMYCSNSQNESLMCLIAKNQRILYDKLDKIHELLCPTGEIE